MEALKASAPFQFSTTISGRYNHKSEANVPNLSINLFLFIFIYL